MLGSAALHPTYKELQRTAAWSPTRESSILRKLNISETRFFEQYLRQNKNTCKKMAFLPRQKPGFFKKPGFLNLDAGEGIV